MVKNRKTMNLVTPTIMTISFLIVFAICFFGNNPIVSWLTVFFAFVATIFAWLLYDAYKQFDVVVDIAESTQKECDLYSEQLHNLAKELSVYQEQNEQMIKMLRSYP